MKHIVLTSNDLVSLQLLEQRTRNRDIKVRTHCLLLSNEGLSINELANIFKVHRRTIEQWFINWNTFKFNSLVKKTGKKRLTLLEIESDLEPFVNLNSWSINEFIATSDYICRF